ncbi:MAG: sulfite exporter TauE/SafE family protein [Rhodospirillaceae bacterium]|nr:sulfite exporter TauE/SafE family protein [Rhodospirillaceae bacterium]
MDFAQFDWTIYWFMFPVAMCVATAAMLSGIGGAAMFAPIFMIIFPLLGPEYPLQNIAAAIGVALMTEVFGFSSGFIGYYRKGLIDFRNAIPFIAVGVPIGIIGALLLTSITDYEEILRSAYGLLMLILSYELIRSHKNNNLVVKEKLKTSDKKNVIITGRDGKSYSYPKPRQGKGAIATGVGGFLTGLLGVGIGEVVMPQLTKRNNVPIPVAAATSVFIVIIVVAAASFTQISSLVAQGGFQAVPWNVVIYTIPAVIIGGQIGPRLQGKIEQRVMERCIGYLFLIIGISMSYIAIRNSYFL